MNLAVHLRVLSDAPKRVWGTRTPKTKGQRLVAGVGGGFGFGGGRRGADGVGEAFLEGFDEDVEDGDEDEVEGGGGDHAAENGGADGLASDATGAASENERENAEDEGEGSHQDGAETDARGFDGGFHDGPAAAAELFGKFDDEDGVRSEERRVGKE